MWTYSSPSSVYFPGVSSFFREGSKANQGVASFAVFRFFRVLIVGARVYRAKQMDDPDGEGRMPFAEVQILVVISFILSFYRGLEVM